MALSGILQSKKIDKVHNISTIYLCFFFPHFDFTLLGVYMNTGIK